MAKTVNPQVGVKVGQNVDPARQPIGQWDWFALSRTWINGSEDRLQKQVDSLQNAIKWFFTLSSSATIVGVLFKDPKIDTGNLLLLGGALLLLLLAYAFATLAITLVSKSIDEGSSAASIQKTFNRSNFRSHALILSASVMMVAGMGLFPIGVVESIKPESPKAVQVNFKASWTLSTGKDSSAITDIDVSGFTSDSTQLTFRLAKGQSLASAIPVDAFKHPLAHGRYDLSFHLKKPVTVTTKYNYYLTQIYKSASDTLMKTVKLNP